MTAFFSHHLETERLPSGVFFANPGRAPPGLDLEANAHPFIASVFPTFPNHQKQLAVGQKPALCLPLLDVTVNVRVDSAIASTKLVQRFTNISADNIPEAHYTFPLYDRAVVTSFRCEIGDSKLLEGQVKPKADAKREYTRAIEKMEAAALLEEHTPEVFETRIGNIPGKSVIRVEITYVNELEPDLGGDGVLLTIPTSIAPRYGHSPQGISSASEVTETGLRIDIAVISSGHVKKLESRTHPVSVEFGRASQPPEASSFSDLAKQKSRDEAYDPRRAMAHLAERDASMGKDFVLLIQTSGSSLLRSGAVLSPPNAVGHSALMVTVKPSELFTDLPTLDGFNGEIIFLADRSGSMAGSKINTLRDALGVFLKSLPGTCFFNLFSFGSDFSSLWDTSEPYNQQNLETAVAHVSGFQNDMGGTKLLPALKQVVERRIKDASSTQVILLTDGEVWKTEETIGFVRKTASELGEQVRFFALGIGNEVSHRLIQGIAGEGGGLGEVAGVDGQGDWQGRVIRMLSGALMPKSWTYQIDLGPEYAVKSLEVDDFMEVGSNSSASSAANLASYIQAPRQIPALHHFNQKSVFFLISSKSGNPPTEVTVTAKADGGLTSTTNLPVIPTVEDASTIQHLAVKAALVDLESHTIQDVSQITARQNAERMGEMYSISSKWTSFVAVDRATQAIDEINMYKAPSKELSLLTSPARQRAWLTAPRGVRYAASSGSSSIGNDNICLPPPPPPPPYISNAPSHACSYIGRPRCRSRQSFASATYLEPLCANSPSSSSDSFDDLSWKPSCASFDEEPKNKLLHRRYLPRCAKLPHKSSGPAPTEMTDIHGTDPLEKGFGHHSQVREFLETPPTIDAYIAISIDSPWSDIVASQTAKGIFQLDDDLRRKLANHFCPATRGSVLTLIGDLNDEGEPGEDRDAVVDTLMMICYVETHLYQKKDLWDLMIRKAENAVATYLPSVQIRVQVQQTLKSSIVHLHDRRYKPQMDLASPQSKKRASCLVCAATAGEAAEAPEAPNSLGANLCCGFDECEDVFENQEDLWVHQVSKSHVKCETEEDTTPIQGQEVDVQRPQEGQEVIKHGDEELQIDQGKKKRSSWISSEGGKGSLVNAMTKLKAGLRFRRQS
ncbi:von Willebrand factor type A domain-containing protein [Ilyonectria robusta]|uniref:von Willebrand factor type A domain-containing protein n=1 Tax=Ilyonectria robusta TaxID=1079257 RepID=UPI001E8D56CF|nr:von Willebrand factor type A domain-containing protein [Ilyonectria robusta]KAH8648096.1 von Willebrand factor type A domain-containing protein [Ilyonectria robusta]